MVGYLGSNQVTRNEPWILDIPCQSPWKRESFIVLIGITRQIGGDPGGTGRDTSGTLRSGLISEMMLLVTDY